jgi:hypothetical protein
VSELTANNQELNASKKALEERLEKIQKHKAADVGNEEL